MRKPLTSCPRQPRPPHPFPLEITSTRCSPKQRQGWVGVGRGDFLEEEANTIHLATVQSNAPGCAGARARAYMLRTGMPPSRARVQLDSHYCFCREWGMSLGRLEGGKGRNVQGRRWRGVPWRDMLARLQKGRGQRLPMIPPRLGRG